MPGFSLHFSSLDAGVFATLWPLRRQARGLRVFVTLWQPGVPPVRLCACGPFPPVRAQSASVMEAATRSGVRMRTSWFWVRLEVDSWGEVALALQVASLAIVARPRKLLRMISAGFPLPSSCMCFCGFGRGDLSLVRFVGGCIRSWRSLLVESCFVHRFLVSCLCAICGHRLVVQRFGASVLVLHL